MSDFVADTSPHLGFQITKKPVRVVNPLGLGYTPGQVLLFNACTGSASPAQFGFGREDGAYTVVAPPGAATFVDGYAFLAVIAEAIGPFGNGMAWLWHPNVLVNIEGACTKGQPLLPTSTNGSSALRVASTPGARCAAIAHADSAGTNVMAFFMGTLGTGKGPPT